MVWRVSEEENIEVNVILGDSYDEIENDASNWVRYLSTRQVESASWTLEVDVIISYQDHRLRGKTFVLGTY